MRLRLKSLACSRQKQLPFRYSAGEITPDYRDLPRSAQLAH
jgi:hypothetical protein